MLVSWDTEYRFDHSPITGQQVQPLTCLSWAAEDGGRGVKRWCDGAKEVVAKILTHHVSVGVSIANDVAVVCQEWPEFIPLAFRAYEENRIRCLKIEGKLHHIRAGILNKAPGSADPRAPYGMASLAGRYLGKALRPDKNELRQTFGPLRDVPFELWPEDARVYPQEDADIGLELALAMPDAGPDKFRQAKYAFMARLWTAHGVRTDLRRVRLLRKRLETAWLQHRGVLEQSGMIRQERKGWVRNEKKMREFVGGLQGAIRTPASKTYPEGQWSLNGVLLEEMGLFSDQPVCLAYSKYASLNKRLVTEIPRLEQGELHCFYDSLINTGRMACGAEDDDDEGSTNLTNLPRKGGIRECYVPRPGRVFWDADCDALEGKTGAQCCLDLVGFSEMADILTAKEGDPKLFTSDFHIHTAAAILRIPVPEALRRMKQYKIDHLDTEIATTRQFAKIANYGLAGGMGIETFYKHIQKELKKDGQWELARRVTMEETARTWAAWRERYPEWPAYFAMNGGRLEESGGFVEFEHLYSGRVRGVGGFNAYATLNNNAFQGLGADLTKEWAWRVTWECYDWTLQSSLLDSRVCIYAHDSLTGEALPEAAHDAAMRVGALLSEVSPNWTPEVPATTKPCLTMRFSKDAKDIVDKVTGRLVPWDDDGEKEEAA